jgi:Zn-dependent protease with chaperone function
MSSSNNPQPALAVTWFDGKSAAAQSAQLLVANGTALVVTHNAASDAGAQHTLARASVSGLQVSSRMGAVPSRVVFPDGGVAVASSDARDTLERLIPAAQFRDKLAKMEASPALVALALVGLIGLVAFMYRTALPHAARFAAHRIPIQTETALGDRTLAQLDRFMFKRHKLEVAQIETIGAGFKKMAQVAELGDIVTLHYRGMQPNALALPGGHIVLTDSLVKLMGNDTDLVMAVLAHELGHVYHRHTMQSLIKGSASALIVGALAGDVSGLSTLAMTAPVALSSIQYTRAGEYEADRYAIELLQKVGLTPEHFARAMERFQAAILCVELKRQDREKWEDESEKTLHRTHSEMPPNLERDEADVEIHPEPKGSKDKIAAMKKSQCYEEPEKYLAGREADLKKIRLEERDTGYLHTHPATQERINAARAASEKISPR